MATDTVGFAAKRFQDNSVRVILYVGSRTLLDCFPALTLVGVDYRWPVLEKRLLRVLSGSAPRDKLTISLTSARAKRQRFIRLRVMQIDNDVFWTCTPSARGQHVPVERESETRFRFDRVQYIEALGALVRTAILHRMLLSNESVRSSSA